MHARRKALMAERTRLLDENKALVAAMDTDNRASFTPEERAAVDARNTRIEEIDGDMSRFDRMASKAEALANKAVDTAKKVYTTLAEQLLDVAMAARADADAVQRQEAFNRLSAVVTNAAASGLNVATPSDGGFLIQPDVVTSILERVYSIGEVIQRCKPQPLSGNSLKIPAVDETSRADGSRFGGIRAYWTEEAGTISSSAPKFRQIELHLRKVAALVYTTDELQADAPALAGFIASRLPDELMFTIENAIFNGTGAGMPLGIFNSGAIITVSKETSQAATTLLAMNLKKMWARMWASCRKNAAWFYNQDCEPYLWSLYEAVKNVAGTENVGGYVTPVVSVAPDGSIRIFGRPAIPVEYCSTLGTLGDIVLADMSQYILATKSGQGVQAASSMHVRFINDEMAYRFTFRVDGQPEWNTTLTPKNGSNTLSPFVIVETRS